MVYFGSLKDNPFLPKVVNHPFTLPCPGCSGEIVVMAILVHSPDCLVCHTPLEINPQIVELLDNIEWDDEEKDRQTEDRQPRDLQETWMKPPELSTTFNRG